MTSPSATVSQIPVCDSDTVWNKIRHYVADWAKGVLSDVTNVNDGVLSDVTNVNDGVPVLVEHSANITFDTFLAGLPAELRQENNCKKCRIAFNLIVKLMVVHPSGSYEPLWPTAPQHECREFAGAFRAVGKLLEGAKPVRFWIPSEQLGTSEEVFGRDGVGKETVGPYGHFYLHPFPALWESRSQTAFQKAAELLQDKSQIESSITRTPKFNKDNLLKATVQLRALPGAEKEIVLLEKLAMYRTTLEDSYDGIIYRLTVEAPAGLSHINQGVCGAFCDAVLKDEFSASSRWAEIKHPLIYQRAQVAPSEGNLYASARLIEKLGLRLDRRFASKLDLTDLLIHSNKGSSRDTQPPVNRVPEDSPFHGIATKSSDTRKSKFSDDTPIDMTFAKFRRTVLNPSVRLEARVPSNSSYTHLTTAAVESPNYWAWGTPESMYTYPNGSHAENWSLVAGEWKDAGIYSLPWVTPDGKRKWLGSAAGVLVSIDGAHDKNSTHWCLFASFMTQDTKSARSSIEALSTKNTMGPTLNGEARVGGFTIVDGSNSRGALLRVTTVDGGRNTYNITGYD